MERERHRKRERKGEGEIVREGERRREGEINLLKLCSDFVWNSIKIPDSNN